MEKLKVNGIEIAYVHRGMGNALVLLHGYPLDHHLWDEILPFLEEDFDLVVPDLRGFGESTMTDAPITMNDYASDIARLLDMLGIQKTAIVGHSMGGYVALTFARLYPKRVRGLALISSQVLADPPDRKEGRYKSAADVEQNGISSVVEAMTPKFTSDPHLQAFARKSMEGQKPAAYIGALKAMAERVDSTSLLPTFTFPVVLIHGNADALISIDRAREAKAAIPNAYLVEINGAGHMPMMEAVNECAEALGHLT